MRGRPSLGTPGTGAGRSARILGCLTLLVLGACGRQEAGRWNVLLVLVDTLRADRTSLHGYSRPTTPGLEAFAAEAVVFTNARSQAGCTFPSVNSLLTSRLPAEFLRPGGTVGIPETTRSLPEILGRHGWATAAVSASPMVRNTPSRINRVGGFGRGFDRFDESCLWREAGCVNARALAALDDLGEPWFLYLHTMEPHAPYRPPRDHARRFAAAPEEARRLGVAGWARRGEAWPVARRLYYGSTRYELTPRNLAHLSDLYDEEVAHFDRRLAQLLEALRERGVLERTLVVLASDHGEELHEHGQWGHCRSLAYETVLRTPLLVRLPGAGRAGSAGSAGKGSRGVRRDALVENLDVVPTVLDYLGLPAADLGLAGASLRPVIERGRPVRRLSFGLQGVKRTVTDGTDKLIYDLASGAAQLFDLRRDPGETTDLAARRPDDTRRLQAALLSWIESREGPVPSGESLRRAREHEKKLRALGYL